MSTNKKLQELQNLAWRSLSGEFKEVVKNYYQYALKHYQISSLQRNVANTLEHFFGTDNLTSDAEGEEMLTVPRIQIQKLYSSIKKVNDPSSKDYINGVLNTLDALFGSKCLPDEGTDCTPVEPKPAEPFKVGDKVKVVNDDHHGNRYIGRVTEITSVDDSDDIYPYKTDLYDDLLGDYGMVHDTSNPTPSRKTKIQSLFAPNP